MLALRDVLTVVRSPLRTKRLSPAVVLTLGLGIGFVSIVFNLSNAYLWRPLPFERPDRLVAVIERTTGESWCSPRDLRTECRRSRMSRRSGAGMQR